MVQGTPERPVLFCYDGSEGSRQAMRTAAELIGPPGPVIVLTVWEPIAYRLALSGAFAVGPPPNEDELDKQEESIAQAASEEGARRASAHGYEASAITRASTEGIARAVMAVAEEVSARLIVCGQRGRGPLKTALLGSVSHALAAHTRRPVLIAPEHEVA
jgi:nucleotide-binding universal stress UspA family protein